MKILVACMQFDYGNPDRGLSYDYANFYQTLQAMGHEALLFDFMVEIQQSDKAAMQQKLLSLVQSQKPDLAFFCLYTDEFDAQVIHEIRKYTKTLCFFHDDTWRVEFSRFWAKQFDFFTTPDVYGEYKYQKLGLNNAIYFPFGCNKQVFKKLDVPKKIDVSFIGAWHPYRNWLINNLRKAGMSVYAAGFGWPEGPLTPEAMIRVFNESKINLNLSNSTSWDLRYLKSSPRALINSLRSPKNNEQIKARHFEINSCGAFQLSYYIEGLERHYEIGKEIAVYLDPIDLVQKVQLYLQDDDLRAEIAAKAYQRSLSCHSYESRFHNAFDRMGLPA